MPGGSFAGSCAAFATSNRSTCRSVPTMRNCPSPNSMSAAEASSRFAAICLPLSMIFSDASCSAEPPTGRAREPPVRPRGRAVRVAIHHVDAVGVDAEPVGHELLVRGDEPGAVFLIAHHEIDAVALELDRGGLGETAAAALRVGRHADAAQLAALLALPAARLEARPVGLLHRGLHDLDELAGIEGELGRRRVGDRLLRNEIDLADAVRRHVHLARRRIDEPLDQVRGFRPAGAAIGAHRHRVGAHALHVDGDRGRRVEAGDQVGRARRDERAHRREVRADIGDQRHAQARGTCPSRPSRARRA